MTETGKNEDKADLPLEGSPNKNGEKSVDVTDMEVSDSEDANKSDTGKSTLESSSTLPQTPTANRLSDAAIFKTPEPMTPTSAKKRKRLTPEEKSLREKDRLDKRRKLEEEKQKKEQERVEKARQKEAEKVKKEEEKRRLEEEKRLDRNKKEEEKKRLEEEKKQERMKKEEEKKKVEEEKKQEKSKKEEEKKRKDDEKRQKDEEKERERLKLEEKKAKQAKFFTNFFQKSSTPKVQTIENGSVRTVRASDNASGDSAGAERNSSIFNPLPFQIKTDMAVAPLCRRKLSSNEREFLDSLFRESSTCADDQLDNSNIFFKSIKKGKGRTFGKTEIVLKEADIQIVEDNAGNSKPLGCLKWRMKLLQFHDNRRPAYWGTWKRKHKKVKARRPLIKEDEVDYDFDSDDEWEDEPDDGEEIENSGGEGDDQEEGADPDEDEEGWMVPHGYLSDGEREGKNDDLESIKCKEKEFYKSLKEKTLIGFPFIMTDDLSCYSMRLCPVFRSATVVKPRRKPRAPKKKAEETKVPVESVTSPVPVKAAAAPVAVPPSVPVKAATAPATASPSVPVKATAAPVPVVVLSPLKLTGQKKSQRKRKTVEAKPNPYAQPSSGFLAMDLPSDDDEDIDWDSVEMLDGSELDESSASDSESDGSDSDSNDDLFIPIPPRPKQ